MKLTANQLIFLLERYRGSNMGDVGTAKKDYKTLCKLGLLEANDIGQEVTNKGLKFCNQILQSNFEF